MKIKTADFINILYAPLLEKEKGSLSGLYLGAKGSRERTMSAGRIDQLWRNIGETDTWIKDINTYTEVIPHNLNYTVAPRSKPDAKKRFVAGSSCFWADIDDFLFYKWKTEKYPKMAGTWIEPNIIVDSGWGVHLYWLFDSFEAFGDGTGCTVSSEKFARAMRMLSWYMGADFSTCSPEHLMRMPGTYNCKSSPYKYTEITVVSETRQNFTDLSAELEAGVRTVAESPRTPEIIKAAVNDLLKIPAVNDKNRSFAGSFVSDAKDASEILGKLSKNQMGCRMLDCAFKDPQELSYTAWFGLCSALCRTINDRSVAYEVFRVISLPGNRSSNPEEEIKRKFEDISQVNYMPPGPGKVPECLSCPRFVSGRCRNMITVIRKTIESR